jgi:hypothetical protein
LRGARSSDYVVRYPADSELALTIEAAFEKPGSDIATRQLGLWH